MSREASKNNRKQVAVYRKQEHTEQGHPRQDHTSQDRAEQSRLSWLIPLAVIAALVLLYLVWPGFRSFADEAYRVVRSGDRAQSETWVSGFGAWGPALIYALMVAQMLLAFIPSLLVTLVPVLAYGPVWGGLLAWSGLLLAALVAYGVGRSLGPVTVERLIGHKTERQIEGFVEHYGIWRVVAARVSPALSTDAVSFVAGLVKMKLGRIALATALGTLPLVVLIAFLGSDFERLRGGLIWVSVLSVVTFVLYVVWDRRRRRIQGER